MRIFSEADFRLEAEPVLRQVFVNDDAFGQPFSPNIVARTITYPHSEYIEPPLIDAIIAASNLVKMLFKDVRDYQIAFLGLFLVLGIGTRDWTLRSQFIITIILTSYQ